jgi:hypothetical protein
MVPSALPISGPIVESAGVAVSVRMVPSALPISGPIVESAGVAVSLNANSESLVGSQEVSQRGPKSRNQPNSAT